MVDTFLQHLVEERRLSSHTVRAYAKDLAQCEAYLATLPPPGGRIEDASGHSLRSWVMELSETGLSNRSINRKIAALRAFYKFLYIQAHIPKDPTLGLHNLKCKEMLPVFVREEELIALLESDAFADTFEGWRDKLTLELLYGTGIRLSELLNLKDESVDLYNQVVRVQGKGKKTRIVPFPRGLCHIIKQYKSFRAAIVPHHNGGDFLLITASGLPCYPMLIYRSVNKYLRAHTHADRHSPHVMRHTFATHLLARGASLNAIKELLGHKSLASTQLYTHHSLKHLQEEFKLAHPRA